MAASVRRLHRLRSSLSSLPSAHASPSTAPCSQLICGVEPECSDRLGSVEQSRLRVSGLLGSLGRSSSSPRSSAHSTRLSHAIPSSPVICGVEPECADRLGSVKETRFRVWRVLGVGSSHFSWRFGSFVRAGGWHKGPDLGDRGFGTKPKKSGGKARNDDGGSQLLATPGPSAEETASRLMEAALNALSVELSKLRTGRASPGMLDHVNVKSHGVQTSLSHVAAVSVSSLETLTVMPYDASMVKEVEKAIRNSPLKLNPVEEGEVLRVPIPKLTKEHIQTMTKLVGKAGETAKLSVRRARKDAMDIIAKGGFSKDAVKRYEKEVEDLTKKYVKSVEEDCKSKEKEILGNS